MRLAEHPDFEQAVLGAADHFQARGLRASIIEKDYYVTEALRIIARTYENQIIFKGGTSLSKGWNLIQRFSEDIDILKKTWSTGLDPSQFEMELRPYGSKALIDACKPHRHLKSFPATTLLRREVYERVSARWAELGFSEPPPRITTFHKN